jgi:hypothetical protein
MWSDTWEKGIEELNIDYDEEINLETEGETASEESSDEMLESESRYIAK